MSKRKFIVLLFKEDDDDDPPEAMKRTANTLVPIIQKYIQPGSIIYSDKWKVYDNLNTLGYKHFTINHAKKFVTQNIERLWRDMKAWIKSPGNRRAFLKQYIARYLFVTNCVPATSLLHDFFLQAATLYPPRGGVERNITVVEEASDDAVN